MLSSIQTASYGRWKSPITAETLSSKSISLDEVQVNVWINSQCDFHSVPETGAIYVVEGRPVENGRCSIVEYLGSTTKDILPKAYNARSKIHEYGGAAFCIGPRGTLIFTDWETNGVFTVSLSSGDITPIITGEPLIHFADFSVHPIDQNWILAVQEDRSCSPIQNRIVVINTYTYQTSTISHGADFYTHPRFSDDGSELCWIQWSHPDMPWNGTELWKANWSSGELVSGTKVAGEAHTESICQPRWGKDGTLLFVCDRTKYWQLYRLNRGECTVRHISLKGLENAEFGERENWLGNCTYVPLTANVLVASYTRDASNAIVVIDLETETYIELPLGLIDIRRNAIKRVSDFSFVVVGTSAIAPQSLYFVDIREPTAKKLIKSSADIQLPERLFSKAQHIGFPRIYGSNQTGSGYAIYLPPNNPQYQAPDGDKPPLIVSLHGGPTSHISPGLLLQTQYWTSRGYAYVHVNYAGSTGYGRAYRELLKGEWGIIDVADAASCVAYLVSNSCIDRSRVGIVGCSAGGYSVLRALYMYPDIWAGGVSHYGIGNLKALADTMHKFESHYTHQCLFQNGITAEEQDKIFLDRSPCHNSDKIIAPLLLLQGTEDSVVPPSQATEIAKIIRDSGGTVKVVLFEGEGHGFRQESTLMTAIELEAEWWVKTLLHEVGMNKALAEPGANITS